MTQLGGPNFYGNVFSVGVNGTNYQNLVSFTGNSGTASGDNPCGSLILAGTTLYGMTEYGGTNSDGNVFSVGVNGANYENLLSFTGTAGASSGLHPLGSLTLIGTTLYGLTSRGGGKGDGNIFSVGINGNNYQNLVSFTGTGGSASGLNPLGSLTLSNTTLYGMTADGGADSAGNIFGVGTDGTGYQNLVSFTGTSGSASGLVPFGSLTVSNTTMYGMTFGERLGRRWHRLPGRH